MNTCKHCLDTIYTDYDTCMTCFEKQNPPKNIMEKTIEDYQKEIKSLKNELECYKKNGDVKSDVVKRQKDILDKTLFELPVGSITQHTYENIPERVAYYIEQYASLANDWESAIGVIEYTWPKFFHSDEMTITQTVKNLIKEANDGALSAWAAGEAAETLKEENQNLLEKLEALKVKSRLFKSAQDGQEYLKCLHQQDNKNQSVGLWIEDAVAYKEALEEIIKRPRKSETCRLIAQKALGLLSDDEYQPELLIEQNLRLQIKVEDLESKLADAVLDKISVMKPKPTLDDTKQPTYAGEAYCNYCNKFHWIGVTCFENPEYNNHKWTNKEADTSCVTPHPTHCQDCGNHIDYHHEERCEARKPQLLTETL